VDLLLELSDLLVPVDDDWLSSWTARIVNLTLGKLSVGIDNIILSVSQRKLNLSLEIIDGGSPLVLQSADKSSFCLSSAVSTFTAGGKEHTVLALGLLVGRCEDLVL